MSGVIILLIYYYCFPLSLSPCLPPVPPCLRNARPYKAKAGVRVNITRRDGRAIPVAPRAQVVGVVSALGRFDPATGCYHFSPSVIVGAVALLVVSTPPPGQARHPKTRHAVVVATVSTVVRSDPVP